MRSAKSLKGLRKWAVISTLHPGDIKVKVRALKLFRVLLHFISGTIWNMCSHDGDKLVILAMQYSTVFEDASH